MFKSWLKHYSELIILTLALCTVFTRPMSGKLGLRDTQNKNKKQKMGKTKQN